MIAATVSEALETIRDNVVRQCLWRSWSKVVIEEFLIKEEASFICIVDGETVVPMATSQDHKAQKDGDWGSNTGGMGAYSPAPVVTVHP